MTGRKCAVWLLAAMLLLGSATACTSAKSNQTGAVQTVAMGSVVQVQVYGGTKTRAQELAAAAGDSVQALDRQTLSIHETTAELYRLNHTNTAQAPAKVSDALLDALAQTKEIYAHSDKKAALASGALTALWGVDIDAFRVPSTQEIAAAMALCTDDTVTLSRTAGTVSFAQGQVLNLGSVGKGIACDGARAVLQDAIKRGEITGAIISVGGSVGALGSADGEGTAWRVGIRDPYGTQNDYFATLQVGTTFLSTSGSYEKQFTENGKTYHHILDLTTGYPAESPLCAVTVSAQTGLQSDALSTLCFLLGAEDGCKVLELYNAEAVFVYADKTIFVTEGLKNSLQIENTAYTYR